MNDTINWTSVLQTLFGGAGLGATVGFAIYLALLAAKTALAEAVRLAGQKEIEARKTELAKDLEDHKKGLLLEIEARKTELATGLESFKKLLTLEIEQTKAVAQREIERERATALRELERFKSELTLPSESRRQVAALRVKTLLDFLRVSQAFMRDAFNVGPNDLDGRARMVGRMQECFDQVREIEPLVSHDIYVQLSDLVSQIFIGAGQWSRGEDAEVPTRILDKLKRVIQLVREELGVAQAVQLSPEQSPPGKA
ncbi:MAG: hypothetical protein EPO40_21940 [Myxococcaceae bacterium]|nr:MAG: hypothetical protein EPO40_21940 [Myxococcaceae bacterium]